MRCTTIAWHILATVLISFAFTCPVSAQAPKDKAAPDTTPPAVAPAQPAADANRPASAEFQRLMEEWKTVLKDLRKLKVEYQTAALADQAKIQQQWIDLVEKGNKTVEA